MAIVFKCSCGQGFKVKDELAGRSYRCTNCQKVAVVPQPAAAAPRKPDPPPNQPLEAAEVTFLPIEEPAENPPTPASSSLIKEEPRTMSDPASNKAMQARLIKKPLLRAADDQTVAPQIGQAPAAADNLDGNSQALFNQLDQLFPPVEVFNAEISPLDQGPSPLQRASQTHNWDNPQLSPVAEAPKFDDTPRRPKHWLKTNAKEETTKNIVVGIVAMVFGGFMMLSACGSVLSSRGNAAMAIGAIIGGVVGLGVVIAGVIQFIRNL